MMRMIVVTSGWLSLIVCLAWADGEPPSKTDASIEKGGQKELRVVPDSAVSGHSEQLKKFDGSIVSGDIVEFHENSVVVKLEGADDPGRMEVPYNDLELIKFRAPEDQPKIRKVLFDTRRDPDRKAEKTATVKLRAGKQRFGLAYLHKSGPAICKLEYSGPGINRSKLNPNSLLRAGQQAQYSVRDPEIDAEGFMRPEVFTPEEKGVFVRVHEFGADSRIDDYADFKSVRTARYAAANSVDLGAFKHANSKYAAYLHGFLLIPTDGEYTFYLNASQDTVFWFGNDLPSIHPGSPNLMGTDFTVIGADGGTWWGALFGWGPDSLKITAQHAGVTQEIETPVSHLQEVWTTPVVLKEAKVDRAGEPKDKDSIYVKTADGKSIQRVTGRVLGQEGDSLQVDYEGQKRGLKMARVVGVVFQGQRTKAAPSPGTLVLSGGHRLPGTIQSGSRGKPIVFKTGWGQVIEWPYDRCVFYEVRNGRNVWLTDLQPTSQESVPYFDNNPGWSADKSLRGGELKIADKSYPRGLCTHSHTTLTYDITGYSKFESDLGVQHEDGRLGRAAVRILVDGQVVFENTDLKLESGRVAVSVDVQGRKTMTLDVDFGETFDVGDDITWGGARLVR